ncbi:two-component regulator propeller domain-containing protein [Zobellia galactanivorans]|uniref:hybrid sensor histidine kinase/response regulator transcription factor n=1 Tax=Zobellia galactanivorans (strain DSM 12802 / CCUG 47099 / CIP 106680 / NCIMB 13871 / Dsij) TaxID=63186 RepID=UPI0026E2CCC1|nr:two-component regulator propeller domain-containing protein [Zobellia galactanivorans]MDO6807362.1 two-component regulator propeller domain-containing protein [Zobellia galactanivorans]
MSKNIYSTFICLFFFLCALAQESQPRFSQNYTISNGLAHNGVTSILEDSRGFIWVGTYEGLNLFDGYEFKTFKNTVGHDLFVSNRIRSLQEDSKGNIWIGTDEGISVYDYTTQKFTNIYSNQLVKKAVKGPIVRDIVVNENLGIILCATEKYGVLIFNDDYSFKDEYSPTAFYRNGAAEFYGSAPIDDSTYLYATSVGLLSFDLKTHQFSRVLPEEIRYCQSLLRIDPSTFLVTLKSGVLMFSYGANGKGYDYSLLQDEILPEHNFNSSAFDLENHLWLGTLNSGAIRIDDINALRHGSQNQYAPFSFENKQLRMSCFESTKEHGFWVGSFDKGLYRFDLKKNPFKEFKGNSPYEFGVSDRHLINISPLDDHRVYLTKNRGGLALFNTERQKFDPLPFSFDPKYASRISSVYVDTKNRTWLKVAQEGYFLLKPGETEPQRIDTSTYPEFSQIDPYKITEDQNGNLWLGCKQGVFKITVGKEGKVLRIEALNDNPYFENSKITLARYVYADPLYQFIWVGTAEDGLFRVDTKDAPRLSKAKITHFRATKKKGGLPNNFVSAITRSPEGNLWIGTEGSGICKVENSESTPRFVPFSEKDGLSNNVVKSINIDELGNLWVATNIGLNKFYPKEKKFRKFGKQDGLPFEDFWYASARLKNGSLILAGLEGFSFFSPKSITDSEALPILRFGDFKIFNQTIRPNDTVGGRVLLNERLQNGQTLNLKYNENVFSVEALSLHFASPKNHFLKYRLLPVDQNWFETTSDQRLINYNGLQPGEYSLEVAASNSIGEWTRPKTLHLVISPPFWKTPWAYVLYALLTLLILGTVLFYIIKVQSLRYNIQLEQIEKDKVKEVNAAKLRFFANISHELKTPLNLIASPIKQLSERYRDNPDSQEKLHIVARQSKKISQLIDQIHDFERVDANLMEMDYSRFYFDEFLDHLVPDFHFLAYNSDKKLEIIAKNKNIVVSADRDKLEKVFNNLLSNAFKYTGENDVITITYESDDKDLIVSVTDTGRGIDDDDLPHIFERFYQSRKRENVHSTGSGIGLAFSKKMVEMHYGYLEATSEIGVGTTISVRLPVVKKESADDQATKEKAIITAENQVSKAETTIEKTEISKIKASGDYSGSLIFYVEDDLDMRLYVSKVLSKFFKVKTFTNGRECLDAMEDQWPDLVISDIQMPIMNGLELCKRIKADIKTSHIPVILLTALADIENQIQGIKDGADAYIKKPFDARQLVARTEALLENRKRLRERFEIGIALTKDNNVNNRNDNAFLEKLYHLMAENLDNQNLDMDQFARQLYLNRTHFYQKVKALTDKTPFELLKMYRLKKAAELLVHQPELSVNEVYTMTGFKSRTHFSKLFKEIYGVSPGKYKGSK